MGTGVQVGSRVGLTLGMAVGLAVGLAGGKRLKAAFCAAAAGWLLPSKKAAYAPNPRLRQHNKTSASGSRRFSIN